MRISPVSSLLLFGALQCVTSAPAAAAPEKDALVAKSVMKRFPQFTADDSYSLAKVKEAVALIDKSMLVHATGKSVEYAPSKIGSNWTGGTTRVNGECDKKGLSEFGGVVFETTGTNTFFLDLMLCPEINYQQLPSGTPGVIWGLDQFQYLVFVTLDGGRYHVESPSAVQAGGVVAAGPIVHKLVKETDLDHMPGDSQATDEHAALRTIQAAWNTCRTPIGNKADKEHEAINKSVQSEAVAQARHEKVTAKYDKIAETTCGTTRKKYEKSLIGYLTARGQARQAIDDAATARLSK